MEIVESDIRAVASGKWNVDTVALLQIGTPDSGAAAFHGIRGVVEFVNGTLAVLDGPSQEVRYFSASGDFVGRLGRKGQGPNEFESMAFVPAPRHDSLLAIDIGNRRATVLSSDARILSSYSIKEGAGSPRGALPSQHILGQGRLVVGGREGVSFDVTVHHLTDPRTGLRDTVLADTAYGVSIEVGPRSFTRLPLPFASRASTAVGRDSYFITLGNSGVIREFAAGKSLRRIVRLVGVERPVSSAEWNAAVELRARNSPAAAALRRYYAEVRRPERHPVFDQMLVDEDGFLWAELHRVARTDAPEWMVFSADGAAVARLTTPAGLAVHQIGRRFVLGVWRDSLGVEYVRRYSLARDR
jgi:hypothetical protein